MPEKKPPVMILELIDQRNSGFIKDGTENTMFHEELKCPNILWIPNSGYMAEKVKEGDVEYTINKEIRWIKNCSIIDVAEQEKRGIKPNRTEDKIPFDKGRAVVVRDGSTASLYDYLE